MANWFVSSWSSLKGGANRFLFTEDYNFSLLETPRAAKVTSVSPHVTNFVAVIGSLAAGALLKDGSWFWGILVGVAVAISIFLDYQRDARTARVSNEKGLLQQQAVKDLVLTLIDTTQGTSDALSIEEKRPRQESLASARRAILSTVQQSIGPENGVRVNLFEVTCLEPPTLEASGHGHVGRDNHRSTRVFTSEDETLQLALYRNQGRFVEDTHLAEIDSSLPYQTFATMPVSSEKYLYGILTVDSPVAGDINEFEAKRLLNLYASQFALTFMSDLKNAMRLPIGRGADRTLDQ